MSESLLRHQPPKTPWIIQLWPMAAFFMVQGFAIIWWASGMQAEVRQLQSQSVKFERVLDDVPEMKASLKNIERMVDRLLDAGIGDGRKR